MKWEFIHNENSSRLILIFAGWSTDASFYADIQVEGWDTAVVWDYSDLDFSISLLEGYKTIALFAWSLGVYAAAKVIPFEMITTAVAINGTEAPVDDLEGIPETIFQGTLINLNSATLLKFRKRMCGTSFPSVKDKFSATDNIEWLGKNLESIAMSAHTERTIDRESVWHRVYISTADRIFPPGNQKRFWEKHPSEPEIIYLDEPHFVKLSDLVKSVIPSKVKVAERFREALPTYDENAPAQKIVADSLANILARENKGKEIRQVLEIGPGSGLFTGKYSSFLSPSRITFVDLYPLPVYNTGSHEIYVVADAEEWMDNESQCRGKEYDAVVSASAMQWFANPERFIRNAARMLKSTGVLALSTYLPGNLKELSRINPHGLIYRKKEELEKIIHRYFTVSYMEEDVITIQFDTGRDTMKHLRRTGVGGSSVSSLSLKEMLTSLPTELTSLPLYIFASCPRDND